MEAGIVDPEKTSTAKKRQGKCFRSNEATEELLEAMFSM
jgi:hypothetical protein